MPNTRNINYEAVIRSDVMIYQYFKTLKREKTKNFHSTVLSLILPLQWYLYLQAFIYLKYVQNLSHIAISEGQKGFLSIFSDTDPVNARKKLSSSWPKSSSSNTLNFFSFCHNNYYHSLFFLNDMLQSGKHLLSGQRSKPKPRTTRLKRRNDLRQVVANYAESRVLSKFLNYWNQNRAYNMTTASLNFATTIVNQHNIGKFEAFPA